MTVAFAGLILAVIAELFSVALVGLSGWFIASSAVAGATAYSTFSYLTPSGGVRAFALGRIATNYASRVLLHSAALRRITAARLRFYDRAAAETDAARTWSGESLDRVMADADTKGMAIIQATAPMVVAAAMTAAGSIVIIIAGYPQKATIVAVAAVLCAALASGSVRHPDDASRARGALRNEFVVAVEAWTEMASLGAADQLARRTLQRVDTFEKSRLRQASTRATSVGVTHAVTAAALLLAVVLTSSAGAGVATLVFVVLLAAGVMVSVERLVAAAEAQRASHLADERLNSAGHEPRGSITSRAAYDRDGLSVSYCLPETPMRSARQIDFTVAGGATLVVTGASGSGKTTLLNAIDTNLRRQGTQGVVTAVLADDYLFTGTVSTNMRLADPSVSEGAIRDLLGSMMLERSGLDPTTRIGVDGRTLSGGEQRRLHIARALATQPDVLLIDEPTTGLDADTAGQVLTAIRRRLPRSALVLAMHELPQDRGTLGPTWSTVSLAQVMPWRR
jgi:ATP-binding cassette subfamily C protein CydC